MLHCPTGLAGSTGSTGITGPAGPTGPTGLSGVLGAAAFMRNIQQATTAPGTAFTIDTQIYNSIPADVVMSSGAGGTVFTLSAGTYVIDYEMSLDSNGSVGVYVGPNAGALVLDPTSVAGSTTATTWIHGRAMEVVSTSLVVAISNVVGSSAIVTAGSDAGSYMIRLTFLKIA